MANKRINDLPNVPAPAATARIPVDELTTGSTQLGTKVAGLLAGTANSLAIADTNGLQAALDSKLSGTVPATSGGTGQVSYAVGDLLYAASTTTLAKLAAVATGNVLISGGVDTAPSWGKVGLTTHVDGILPVASGGSGRNTATAYAVLCGGTTSTGAHQSIAGLGSSGDVLTSNGAGALPTFQTPGAVSMPAGAVVGFDYATMATLASNGTVIPLDNTKPQITEGVETLTLAFTPKAIGNKILFRAVVPVAGFANDIGAVAALFLDSTADAIGVGVAQPNNVAGVCGLVVEATYTAVDTSSHTLRLRTGPRTTGSIYINGNNAGTQLFNGACAIVLSYTEVKV